MPRKVQDEILVQVRYVCHAALPGQAKQFAFAFNPCIVGAAVDINLSNRDDLVRDAALLVVPMISFIASPANFCAAELERLRQGEGHGMEVNIDEAPVESDDRQPGRMSLLGEQI